MSGFILSEDKNLMFFDENENTGKENLFVFSNLLGPEIFYAYYRPFDQSGQIFWHIEKICFKNGSEFFFESPITDESFGKFLIGKQKSSNGNVFVSLMKLDKHHLEEALIGNATTTQAITFERKATRNGWLFSQTGMLCQGTFSDRQIFEHGLVLSPAKNIHRIKLTSTGKREIIYKPNGEIQKNAYFHGPDTSQTTKKYEGTIITQKYEVYFLDSHVHLKGQQDGWKGIYFSDSGEFYKGSFEGRFRVGLGVNRYVIPSTKMEEIFNFYTEYELFKKELLISIENDWKTKIQAFDSEAVAFDFELRYRFNKKSLDHFTNYLASQTTKALENPETDAGIEKKPFFDIASQNQDTIIAWIEFIQKMDRMKSGATISEIRNLLNEQPELRFIEIEKINDHFFIRQNYYWFVVMYTQLFKYRFTNYEAGFKEQGGFIRRRKQIKKLVSNLDNLEKQDLSDFKNSLIQDYLEIFKDANIVDDGERFSYEYEFLNQFSPGGDLFRVLLIDTTNLYINCIKHDMEKLRQIRSKFLMDFNENKDDAISNKPNPQSGPGLFAAMISEQLSKKVFDFYSNLTSNMLDDENQKLKNEKDKILKDKYEEICELIDLLRIPEITEKKKQLKAVYDKEIEAMTKRAVDLIRPYTKTEKIDIEKFEKDIKNLHIQNMKSRFFGSLKEISKRDLEISLKQLLFEIAKEEADCLLKADLIYKKAKIDCVNKGSELREDEQLYYNSFKNMDDRAINLYLENLYVEFMSSSSKQLGPYQIKQLYVFGVETLRQKKLEKKSDLQSFLEDKISYYSVKEQAELLGFEESEVLGRFPSELVSDFISRLPMKDSGSQGKDDKLQAWTKSFLSIQNILLQSMKEGSYWSRKHMISDSLLKDFFTIKQKFATFQSGDDLFKEIDANPDINNFKFKNCDSYLSYLVSIFNADVTRYLKGEISRKNLDDCVTQTKTTKEFLEFLQEKPKKISKNERMTILQQINFKLKLKLVLSIREINFLIEFCTKFVYENEKYPERYYNSDEEWNDRSREKKDIFYFNNKWTNPDIVKYHLLNKKIQFQLDEAEKQNSIKRKAGWIIDNFEKDPPFPGIQPMENSNIEKSNPELEDDDSEKFSDIKMLKLFENYLVSQNDLFKSYLNDLNNIRNVNKSMQKRIKEEVSNLEDQFQEVEKDPRFCKLVLNELHKVEEDFIKKLSNLNTIDKYLEKHTSNGEFNQNPVSGNIENRNEIVANSYLFQDKLKKWIKSYAKRLKFQSLPESIKEEIEKKREKIADTFAEIIRKRIQSQFIVAVETAKKKLIEKLIFAKKDFRDKIFSSIFFSVVESMFFGFVIEQEIQCLIEELQDDIDFKFEFVTNLKAMYLTEGEITEIKKSISASPTDGHEYKFSAAEFKKLLLYLDHNLLTNDQQSYLIQKKVGDFLANKHGELDTFEATVEDNLCLDSKKLHEFYDEQEEELNTRFQKSSLEKVNSYFDNTKPSNEGRHYARRVVDLALGDSIKYLEEETKNFTQLRRNCGDGRKAPSSPEAFSEYFSNVIKDYKRLALIIRSNEDDYFEEFDSYLQKMEEDLRLKERSKLRFMLNHFYRERFVMTKRNQTFLTHEIEAFWHCPGIFIEKDKSTNKGLALKTIIDDRVYKINLKFTSVLKKDNPIDQVATEETEFSNDEEKGNEEVNDIIKMHAAFIEKRIRLAMEKMVILEQKKLEFIPYFQTIDFSDFFQTFLDYQFCMQSEVKTNMILFGEFSKDRISTGIQITKNGNIYMGQFKENRYNGEGTLIIRKFPSDCGNYIFKIDGKVTLLEDIFQSQDWLHLTIQDGQSKSDDFKQEREIKLGDRTRTISFEGFEFEFLTRVFNMGIPNFQLNILEQDLIDNENNNGIFSQIAKGIRQIWKSKPKFEDKDLIFNNNKTQLDKNIEKSDPPIQNNTDSSETHSLMETKHKVMTQFTPPQETKSFNSDPEVKGM